MKKILYIFSLFACVLLVGCKATSVSVFERPDDPLPTKLPNLGYEININTVPISELSTVELHNLLVSELRKNVISRPQDDFYYGRVVVNCNELRTTSKNSPGWYLTSLCLLYLPEILGAPDGNSATAIYDIDFLIQDATGKTIKQYTYADTTKSVHGLYYGKKAQPLMVTELSKMMSRFKDDLQRDQDTIMEQLTAMRRPMAELAHNRRSEKIPTRIQYQDIKEDAKRISELAHYKVDKNADGTITVIGDDGIRRVIAKSSIVDDDDSKIKKKRTKKVRAKRARLDRKIKKERARRERTARVRRARYSDLTDSSVDTDRERKGKARRERKHRTRTYRGRYSGSGYSGGSTYSGGSSYSGGFGYSGAAGGYSSRGGSSETINTDDFESVLSSTYLQAGTIFLDDAGGYTVDVSTGIRIKKYVYLGLEAGFHHVFNALSYVYYHYTGTVDDYRFTTNYFYVPFGLNAKIYFPGPRCVNRRIYPHFNFTIGGYGGKGYYDNSWNETWLENSIQLNENFQYDWRTMSWGMYMQVGLGIDFSRFNMGMGYSFNYGDVSSNMGYFKFGVRLGKY